MTTGGGLSAVVSRGRSRDRIVGVAAVAAIVIGAALIIVPLVTSLFSRTSAADRLTTAVRPAMSQAVLDAAQTDLRTVQTAYNQLHDTLIPAMAASINQTPAQLLSDVATRYHDIRAGMADFNAAFADAQSVLATLVANRSRYESADATPMRGFPPTATPWAFIGVGVVLLIVGLVTLRQRRLGLGLLLVVAVAMAVGPLAASVPSKMSDTSGLVDALRGPLSPQGAATARAHYTTFNTMVTEFDSQVLPAFATATHMSDAEVAAFVGQHAPLLASGAPDVPRVLGKYSALTAAPVAQVDNYTPTAEIPFSWLPWLFVVPGLLLTALAGWSLLATRRPVRPINDITAHQP